MPEPSRSWLEATPRRTHARAVLEILGARIWHCGGPGTGHAMKTALNLSNQGKMLLEIEALLMCGRAGLDPDQVADVLELNTWRHFLLGEGGRVPFGFAIDLAVKDWGVAAGVASEHRVPMPIAGAAMQTMRAIRAEAGPDADLIDAVSVMEKWAEYDIDGGLGQDVDHEARLSGHRRRRARHRTRRPVGRATSILSSLTGRHGT